MMKKQKGYVWQVQNMSQHDEKHPEASTTATQMHAAPLSHGLLLNKLFFFFCQDQKSVHEADRPTCSVRTIFERIMTGGVQRPAVHKWEQ